MPPSSPPSFLPRSAATAMTSLPSRYRRRSRSRSPSKGRRRSRSRSPSKGRRRSRSRSRSPSKVRHRSRSPPASKVRRRSRSLSLTKVRRRSRSPPPSKVLRRSRSPPYDTTQRLAELQRAKRPSADAALDGREEEDMAGPSPLDEASVESRPSRSHCSCKHSETSSAAVEKRPDPAIRGDKQELHSEKINGKNQSEPKAPSRNVRRKKMQRQVRTEAKKQMREMKRDKLLENIKKLQDRVWLLEKDGADKAEIMEFRSLLESTKKQYEENEEVLAQAGSSASKQVLNNRLEKRHVETMAAPVEKIEGDEQNMDNGGVEGTSLKSCKHLETSSAAVEKRPDPATREEDQELHSEKMDAKNQSNHKALSRNARRKKMKRQLRRETKNQMREHLETSSAAVEKRPDPATGGEEKELHSEKMDAKNQSDHKAPSRSARRKKMRRQLWTEAKKQIMEMKKDKLLEKIKKLQDCVWLLEKDGADSDEIREFRSLLESTKKQYEENEELLAQAGSSASQQVLNSDILEKTHVETMTAPVEKVERDGQNMDSGEAEGRSLKGCEAVSEENDLAEEVDRLKSEIETVRQDRNYQSAQVQSLMADMAKQKEVVRRYGAELEDAMRRVAALEEGGLLQSEMIRTLQVQLASANKKLTVPSSSRD